MLSGEIALKNTHYYYYYVLLCYDFYPDKHNNHCVKRLDNQLIKKFYNANINIKLSRFPQTIKV